MTSINVEAAVSNPQAITGQPSVVGREERLGVSTNTMGHGQIKVEDTEQGRGDVRKRKVAADDGKSNPRSSICIANCAEHRRVADEDVIFLRMKPLKKRRPERAHGEVETDGEGDLLYEDPQDVDVDVAWVQ
jgi:hypothetical protein